MSQETLPLAPPPAPAPAASGAKSFIAHAKLISLLTLISRILGMARESVFANFFGTQTVSNAFTVAFSIPNLFRKLFGEGALSAALIPLYAQADKNQRDGTIHGESAGDFAAASVNLLCLILLAITLLGEAVIWVVIWTCPNLRPDKVLTLKFTAVMLPYVVLICGAAFLSSILQVHRRFGPPAAAPIVLNVVHIGVIVIGARWLHLHARLALTPAQEALQTRLAFWLCWFVLAAGVMQVAMLLPSLRAVGFRFQWVSAIWTDRVKTMLRLSVPVALGAGVLQLSVLADKAISLVLAQGLDKSGHLIDHFTLLGHSWRYPMQLGAATRLNWAQFLYQFPLGVFAIALATAIFPSLSADALDTDRSRFRRVMRTGIEAALFEGLAASVGLMLVCRPAMELLYHHGQVTGADIDLAARSLAVYASAIWAFSLLQIVNRAYYALHDTRTPLVMAAINMAINLAVELPLIWLHPLGEAGMAAGTSASFIVQALVMLWMLNRKIGGMELRHSALAVGKMLIATAVMGAVCLGLQHTPLYPHRAGAAAASAQLALLMLVGAAVYVGVCSLLGFGVFEHVFPRKTKRL